MSLVSVPIQEKYSKKISEDSNDSSNESEEWKEGTPSRGNINFRPSVVNVPGINNADIETRMTVIEQKIRKSPRSVTVNMNITGNQVNSNNVAMDQRNKSMRVSSIGNEEDDSDIGPGILVGERPRMRNDLSGRSRD